MQIFQKVLAEVDVRVLKIRRELHVKVRHMPQRVEQQKKFVKSLISLEMQQLHSSVANQLTHVDPAWDAIESRAKYLENTFKTTFEQFTARDVGGGGGGVGGSPIHQSAKIRTDSQAANAQPNRVQFCEEICEIAVDQMPDLWRLGQAYFTGELRGVNEPKPGNFKRIILTAIEQFCAYIRAAVLAGSDQRSPLFSAGTPATQTITANIAWPTNTASAIASFLPWLPQCLRYLRISYATLIRLDLPSEVLDIVQKVIDQIRLYCLTTVFKKTLERVRNLEDKERWLMGVADFPGATCLPSHLESLLCEMLEEGQQTCLLPEIRESPLLEPQSEGHREISKRFQDILDAFCAVIETLAYQRCDDDDDQHLLGVSQLIGFPNSPKPNTSTSAITSNADTSVGGGGADGSAGDLLGGAAALGWEQRLLCCLANCAYCNKQFFPHLGTLFEKFGYPVPKLAIGMGRTNVMKLFNVLLETYVEQKSDPLVGTIEPSMYIGRFQWDMVTNTGKLRPYAHECLDNLVSVF